MDSALTSAEKKQLCSLLQIPRHCYGNFPLMKSSFKTACLRNHPDKGGDPEVMKELTCLWQKFSCSVYEMRRHFPTYDEEDDDEDTPLYGTSAFRTWWGRKQHGHRRTETTSSSRRGEPSHTGDSSGYGSSQQSQGSSEFSEPSNSRNPSREDIPSSSSTKFKGGNLFGNSARCAPPPSPWDDESLRCDETLSSPEPPSTEEEPFSESSERTTFTSTQSDEDPFSTPRSPPHPHRRRRPAGSPTPSYSSTPPKPKKPKDSPHPSDFPTDCSDYLSHAIYSNKTMSSFAIFTTREKGKFFYNKIDGKFKVEYKGRFSFKEGSILLILTCGKHRVTAIKNFLQPFCTVSFLVVKGVIKLLDLYRHLGGDNGYRLDEESKSLNSFEFDQNKKEQTCNWTQVTDFAVEYGIEDPLLIMAHYLDFAYNPDLCMKCLHKTGLKPHKAHEKEHANAKLFQDSRSQKSICAQASETVIAKKRLHMMEVTREELLLEKLRFQMEKLVDFGPNDLKVFMAGVAWWNCMFADFEMKLLKILQLITENIPKKRNVLFIGPINSGKTSLAAALLDLLDGKALNVNCPSDKLPFELGCATDKFVVCFEDVKGQVGPNKDLQSGQGFHNLDNLRDHLDGNVSVSLEKKHVNKRHQIFPPCIITANNYIIPKTVFCRIAYTLHFSCKDNLRDSLEKNCDLRRRRVLSSGVTLVLCLIWCLNMKYFQTSLQEDVKKWRDIINAEVGHDMYCKMLENVEAGEDPLHGILEYEEDEED
ncbi:large T antigen [Otomops polyomavirus KY157]|uniref:DNA 3'-5' helicase n=1 Tax=Otomops polyomavirus KY157 TaxID=2035999 RepID=L0GAL1_9POLY|nr:large T antigen [Otomops polyomavirus KY157]AGA82607.1 large T antigen [Otomops polyomavirus KY157]